MSHATRRAAALIPAILVLASPWAAHASCPPSDVTCLVEEGRGLVDDTDDATEPIGTLVDEGVDPVLDTVQPVVDDLEDEVDGLLGGGTDPDPGPGGGGDGSTGGTAPGDEGTRGTGADDPGGVRGTVRPSGGPGLVERGTRLTDASGATILPPRPERPDRFAQTLEGVARSLAVVLALFGLAVAFVTIQGRIDRKDPKLSLAPVGSDLVEFA